MKGYKELLVWNKAIELVVDIYRITRKFPKNEAYGLCQQMQRASVSIPSNIAEGHALKQTPAFLRHLSIATGSLCELETQILISDRLGYLSQEDKAVLQRANEVGRMLFGLRQSLTSIQRQNQDSAPQP